MEKAKRYLVFLIGLFINSLGVSLITKAELGTSPISSIPYVLSLNFPLTLGQFTILFSLLLIVLQLMILGRNFAPEHALQIPVSVAFGWFIDVCMGLLWFIQPEVYLMKVVYLLVGCAVLAIGVYMEMLADVVMLPGESFVRAVVFRWRTEFGLTKVCFDVSMAVIAAVLSLVLSHALLGVREGTVAAAILVGFLARLIARRLSFLPEVLFGKKKAEAGDAQPLDGAEQTGEAPVCIVVDRQYGSGGHDFALKLAEKLGYAFYDQDILDLACGAVNYSRDFVARHEEKLSSGLLHDFLSQMYLSPQDAPAPEDAIFQAEANIIRQAAASRNCVIVGRCADRILEDHPRCLRIFLSAPLEYRVARVMKKEGMDQAAARRHILTIDKERAEYYHYFARRMWGLASNYHLCIDTSTGAPHAEAMVLDMLSYFLSRKSLLS